MNTPSRPSQKPIAPPSAGERVWRQTFFLLSALLAGLALVQFDAGRFAHGLGELGASVLMVSLMVQYPFVRALIRASAEDLVPSLPHGRTPTRDRLGRVS